jgi:hypothetical protein
MWWVRGCSLSEPEIDSLFNLLLPQDEVQGVERVRRASDAARWTLPLTFSGT